MIDRAMGTGYGQFCPVAVASEVLAERWTPLVVRELLFGSTRFNEIRRGVPLMSPTLLARRLRALEAAGVVERHADGGSSRYQLTRAGQELGDVVAALAVWGERWGGDPLHPSRLDPRLLMWSLRRLVIVERLPERRVVVRFELSGPGSRTHQAWFVLDHGVDLCLIDPGLEEDVLVEASVEALVRFYLGRITLTDLIAQGEVRLHGPRSLTRALPGWFRPGGWGPPPPADHRDASPPVHSGALTRTRPPTGSAAHVRHHRSVRVPEPAPAREGATITR